jgi:hypothetical protein
MENEITPTQEPQQTAPQKYRVPVDGKELEVDIDELKRGYSHASAAAKRMAEAAAIRKAEQARREKASQGEFDFLSELGANEDAILKWAEKKLLNKLEYESLPESEKALRAEKRRAEELEKQLEDMTKREREQFEASINNRALQEVDDEIASALESYKGKKTPRLVRRIAEAMYANLEQKQTPLASQKALDIAKKSLIDDVQEYLSITPTDELIKSLSKDQIAAIRRHFVNEAKSGQPIARQMNARRDNVPQKTNPKAISTDDYFNKIERRLKK